MTSEERACIVSTLLEPGLKRIREYQNPLTYFIFSFSSIVRTRLDQLEPLFLSVIRKKKKKKIVFSTSRDKISTKIYLSIDYLRQIRFIVKITRKDALENIASDNVGRFIFLISLGSIENRLSFTLPCTKYKNRSERKRVTNESIEAKHLEA